MRNMLLLIKNTLKLIFRKKSNIIFILLSITIPLIFLSFSFADNAQLRIGIVNKDNGSLSMDMIKSLQNSEKYKIIALTERNLNNTVAKGDVDCAIVIPEEFSNSIIADNVPKLQIVSIKGQEATLLIQNYINLYMKNIKDISKASNGNKDMFYKMYDEYRKSTFTLNEFSIKDKSRSNNATMRSIGFFIMFLMMGTSSISDLMLQEKRDKTFYRICAAPLKSRTYVLSNFIVNAAVTLFQIILIMTFLIIFLKLPIDKSLIEMFVVLSIFGLTSIGLSMLITAFSDSTMQSSNLSTLIITPTCMLGGVFWPIDFMPKALQKISNFVPQKWAVDAIMKIEESSNPNLLINIGILIAFTLAFLLIATYKIKISEKVADFV